MPLVQWRCMLGTNCCLITFSLNKLKASVARINVVQGCDFVVGKITVHMI